MISSLVSGDSPSNHHYEICRNRVKSYIKHLEESQSVLPDLSTFKKRRQDLNLSLREVMKETDVSIATISRLERMVGEDVMYSVVKKLHEYYLSLE